MDYLFYGVLVMVLFSCSNENNHKLKNHQMIIQSKEPSEYSAYLNSRDNLAEYNFTWRNHITKINDTNLVSNSELLEKYGNIEPDFGILDWNNDGHQDLFFEYYAASGSGIKYRIDVHEYNTFTKNFNAESYCLMNPAFYMDEGIITSHYWGLGGGYAFKMKVKNGVKDTLEWISINIYAALEIDSVVYAYSEKPFNDTLHFKDKCIQLPSEYCYEPILLTD